MAILGLLATNTASTKADDFSFSKKKAVAPNFSVLRIDELRNAQTIPLALNDKGVTTGRSQVYYTNNAFLALSNGDIENIQTEEVEWSLGQVINIAGQVGGYMGVWENGTIVKRPFRYSEDEGMIDLGTPEGTNASIVDINDKGEVLGYFTEIGSHWPRHGFIYTDDDGFQALGTLRQNGSTQVFDINNHGDVVGTTTGPNWETHAILWSGGQMIDLTDLGMPGYVTTINDNGLMAGTFKIDWAYTQAMTYSLTEGLSVIPLPEWANTSEAKSIDANGTVYGEVNSSFDHDGFYYNETEGFVRMNLREKNQSLFGVAIVGKNGWVGAHLHDGTAYSTGLIYSKDFGVHRLDELVGDQIPSSEMEIVGINASGQIALKVFDFDKNQWTAFLLTPHAEPSISSSHRINNRR